VTHGVAHRWYWFRIFIFMLSAALPGGLQAQVADSTDASELLADARTFMASYASEIRNGDRVALGRRYDPAGTRELRAAQARWSTQDAIAARYANTWQPPSAFEWHDLVYEVVGPDRVIVSGLFEWTPASGGAPQIQSYTALLRRQPSGELVLGLEAEAGVPRVPWLLLLAIAAVLMIVAGSVGYLVGRRRGRGSRSPRLP
jgi:hypothetical protein